jgi:hypothetical protein
MHLVAFPFTVEFRTGYEGRAEYDLSSSAERAVATTKPPPLPAVSHQVRTGYASH